jgi:hypothetical protein
MQPLKETLANVPSLRGLNAVILEQVSNLLTHSQPASQFQSLIKPSRDDDSSSDSLEWIARDSIESE